MDGVPGDELTVLDGWGEAPWDGQRRLARPYSDRGKHWADAGN